MPRTDHPYELPSNLPVPVDDGACDHVPEMRPPRLTLVIRDGVVEHVFYPVFPPDTSAGEVIRWLSEHPLQA